MIETQETEIPETKTDKFFFLQWVFVCTLGYAIGMTSSSLAGEKIGFPLWDSMVSIAGIAPEFRQYSYVFATVLMGAVFGGITSLGQWFVLRKYIQYATWWVWIGLVGNLLGNLLNCFFPQHLSINYFVPIIINAALMGYFESLVLQKSLPLHGWIGIRIAMNTITLITANLNAANYPAILIDRLLSNSSMGLTSGLLCGVISGLALTWFINRNFQALQSEP